MTASSKTVGLGMSDMIKSATQVSIVCFTWKLFHPSVNHKSFSLEQVSNSEFKEVEFS